MIIKKLKITLYNNKVIKFMDYTYMIFSINFIDINTQSLIGCDIPYKYGENFLNFFKKGYIEDKIKKDEALLIDDSKKYTGLIKLILSKMYCLKSEYSEYIIIDDTIDSNIKCYAKVVRLHDIHLLTHTKIFGSPDGSIEGNFYLQTLFSWHIKYQNLITSNFSNISDYYFEKIINDVAKPRFYNLKSIAIQSDLKIPLYNYQQDNINWMIEREINGIDIPIFNSRMYHFTDGRYYDYNNSCVITGKDFMKQNIKRLYGGTILDDVGVGKTCQMLSLIKSNPSIKTAIVVPSHLISHWESQMEKHFKTPFTNVKLFSHQEFILVTPDYDRIIVDEIHEIFLNDYDLSIIPTIKYRWGLTATPFPDTSKCIIGLYRYITGNFDLKVEAGRYIYNIENWYKLFRKNTLKTIKDELVLPDLNEINHFITLNSNEKIIYDTEEHGYKKDIYALRKICCDIMMKFHDETDTYSIVDKETFINNIVDKYKIKYEEVCSNLGVLEKKLEDLKEEKSKYHQIITFVMDIKNNIRHYEELIKEEKLKKVSAKDQLEHISKLISQKEDCPICMEEVEDEYCITRCRHVFCISCINICMNMKKMCPLCKTPLSKQDISIISNKKNEMVLSSKMTKMLNIINETSDKFIIFTQFDYIISQISTILSNIGVKNSILKNGKYDDFIKRDCKVLIVSSKTFASGIDLSFINNMIIYEPYVTNQTYLKDYENQIIGRIRRIGQAKKCNVYRLICKDTIEEKIFSD